MVNMFANTKKKDESVANEDPKQTPKTEASPAQPQGQQTTLQKLKLEEAQLLEEKKNLAQLKEQLQKKVKDQIESSKENLQKLKNEVSSLKAECAELNETLQNEVFAQ